MDFARNILKLFEERKIYGIFYEQIFTPTLIDEVSDALIVIIQQNDLGISHAVCPNPTASFEFEVPISNHFSIKDSEKLLKKLSIAEFRENAGGVKTCKVGPLSGNDSK